MSSDTESNDDKHQIKLDSQIITPDDVKKCFAGVIEFIIPMPSVKPCNNLEEYYLRSTKSAKSSDTRKSDQFKKPFAVPLERNFHRNLRPNDDFAQGTSSTFGLVTRQIRKRPDVFSRVNDLQASSGPLSHLKDCLGKSTRVLIRRRRKVPYISRVIEYKGNLKLFDKHMNLYMQDVIESFKYETDGKILKRARHRDNVIVRGDNVILVSS